MVKVKNDLSNYWDNIAEKGNKERDLKKELNSLELYYYGKVPLDSIFIENSEDFSKQFSKKLNEKLESILIKYKFFSDEEIDQKKNKFISKLNENLSLIIKKKSFCRISFPAYPLYLFLLAFSSILEQAQFSIEKNQITVKGMDENKIVYFNLNMKNDNYIFFRKGKINLNIKKLASLLKCHKEDKSKAEILFCENILDINLYSKKHHSTITRMLNTLNLDSENFNFNNLYQIEYISRFSLSIEKFEHLLRNIELFSGFIRIIINEKGISFKEIGKNIKNEIFWGKKLIEKLKFNFNPILKQIDNETNIQKKEELKEIIEKKVCSSAHSIAFFNLIGKLVKPLKNNDSLKFELRNNHPIKVIIDYKELAETNLILYHSPIVE